MSWFSKQPVMRPDTIEQVGYSLPVQVDTQHQNYADHLQPADDDTYNVMGTVVAQMHSIEWPGYVRSQQFKGEFTDVSDVVYVSQDASRGYRNNIDQEIGGETSAANAIPMWVKGPVMGKPSNMTGSVATIRRPPEGAYGEVVGTGPDYGRYLATAYYADSMMASVQDYVDASVMAAI